MSDTESVDYKSLLLRAGATHLSEHDVTDLVSGLRAIDGKIALLRDLAGKMQGALPDPVETQGEPDV